MTGATKNTSEPKKVYNFGEKKQEWHSGKKANVDVWKSPKYLQSKEKAISLIEEGGFGLKEGDFWILMNETKNGKMGYTGLIISHNACLKINDKLSDELKFKPSSVSEDKEGYNSSLLYRYSNDKQGIYEVGEVNKGNCKNAYSYAMALKRLFDRVVLKLSKIAYDGIYSEAEAEEFREPLEAPETGNTSKNNTQIDIAALVKNAKTQKELKSLFEEHQGIISGNESVLLLFREKQSALKAAKKSKEAA